MYAYSWLWFAFLIWLMMMMNLFINFCGPFILRHTHTVVNNLTSFLKFNLIFKTYLSSTSSSCPPSYFQDQISLYVLCWPWTYRIAQAGPDLMAIFLLQPLICLNDRYVPLCLALLIFLSCCLYILTTKHLICKYFSLILYPCFYFLRVWLSLHSSLLM